MNERFFGLPQEKRLRMLNAGYRVFSAHSYKKAPMLEIADAAGISKPLLFHYFGNKQALYLYLWEYAMDATLQALARRRVDQASDLFDLLERTLNAKCEVMAKHPHMTAFTLRAYYEQEPSICAPIREDFAKHAREGLRLFRTAAKSTPLREQMDIELFYKEVIWASDGFMRTAVQAGTPDPEIVRRDFGRLIAQWRDAYTPESEG